MPAPDTRTYAGVDALTGAAPAEASPAEGVVPEPPPPAVPEPLPVGPVGTPLVPAPPEPVAEAEPEGPIDESEPAYDPRVDSPEAIRARRWVNGGIVFMVVGGVLTIGGIAMSTAKVNVEGGAMPPCDPRGDPAGNGCTEGGRDRAVVALALPGALLLAGGVAMLTIGKLQQRRVRASLQADRRGFVVGATLRF